jgi:parvulin-like peptidyl-prolyl isomerase
MKKTFVLLAASLVLVGGMTGCSKTDNKAGDKAPVTNSTSSETAKPANGANPQASTATTDGQANTTASTGEASPTATAQPAVEPVANKQPASANMDAAQQKINVEQLPNDMVICQINGHPVTVGEYRRMYKMQQLQMQAVVSSDPNSRARILAEGRKRGVTLTADEKGRLLALAKHNKSSTEEGFKAFLKEKGITESDFDREIEDVGIAVKTTDVILQQNLLNDLVNRELLVDAAKQAGFNNKAMNRYIEIKHSPTYANLVKTTGYDGDDLRDEIVKTEMAKMMMERIQKRALVTNADIQAFYDKNKTKFKHGERVHVAQIIIAAPTQDAGNVQSVKTQVKKANPKLTGEKLEEAVKIAIANQQGKAIGILERARKGDNFADLANNNTDDLPARAAKNGGDMGWHEKDSLVPDFAKVVWPLKTNEVYPKLVQTPLGFHIVKVLTHEGPGYMSLSEVKPQLQLLLAQQKAETTLLGWLAANRKKTQISLAPQFATLLSAEMAKGKQTSAASTTTTH